MKNCVLMGGEWKKKWSVINGRNIKDTDNDKEEKKKIFKDYYNKFKYEVGSQSNWACSSDTEESTAEKSYTNVWGDKRFDNVCQCDGGNIWKDGECRDPYDSGDVITWTHPCWGGRYFSHGKSRGNAQKIDFLNYRKNLTHEGIGEYLNVQPSPANQKTWKEEMNPISTPDIRANRHIECNDENNSARSYDKTKPDCSQCTFQHKRRGDTYYCCDAVEECNENTYSV